MKLRLLHAGDGVPYLRLWEDGRGETIVPMERETGNCYVCTLRCPEEPCLLWYYFCVLMPDGSRICCGADSGEGRDSEGEPASWRITVYDERFQTPEWFCRGVVYQIFPDRFRRSSWEDFRRRAEDARTRGRSVRLHDRWNEEPLYRAAPGAEEYEPDDYFGGDLNGIRQKLPYLRSLGVTCLYLNPVFEADSNHRYNTGDYERIDPLLGTEEEFALLCREAETAGIRILLDGVFSHTGANSKYFNKDGRYGKSGAYRDRNSPYFPWYRFLKYPEEYACWWDFVSLPEVEETEPSYSAYITGENGVLAKWMGLGAAGWRLDVADELPDSFIRLIRERVKKENPDGLLLGEVWEECSAKRGPEGRRGYVSGDELDSAMNYPFANAVTDFLTGRTGALDLVQILLSLQEWYPRPFYRAQLNLISSHDIVRALTRLAGAPDRSELSREEQARFRPSEEEMRLAKLRYPLAAALQAFVPGVPCIYYGDEAGMTGMADPFNRGTYPWDREDLELQHCTAELIKIRQSREEFLSGACRMAACGEDVVGLLRYTREGMTLVLINRSGEERTCPFRLEGFREGTDAAVPLPGSLPDETVTLSPYGILVRKI